MSERWLSLVVEPDESTDPPASSPQRRPVAVGFPIPPPRRHPAWSATVGVLLVAGALTLAVGAWLAATSGLGWTEVVRESAVAGDDLALRSQIAASALTDEFAELEATAATLGDVSTALDTAVLVAADLEAVARTGPPSDQAELDRLMGALFRLAGAIDEAFPGLAEVGIAGPTGPGEALRAASEALTRTSTAPAPASATGFGPFVLHHPLPGHPVTNPFGTTRGESVHNGIDFGAPAGTEIRAAADGVVERAGWLDEAAGNGVIIGHGGGWETRYFHMVSADLPVTVGDRVDAGQVIGLVGSTGLSTGPHLHFEIVFGPVRMDPAGSSFIYGDRMTLADGPSGGPTDDAAGPLDDATITAEGPVPEITALSDVLVQIAAVQTELKDIAADAADGASLLQARTFEQQERARTAALILCIGAMAVVLGLLLMWVTRPQWPPAR